MCFASKWDPSLQVFWTANKGGHSDEKKNVPFTFQKKPQPLWLLSTVYVTCLKGSNEWGARICPGCATTDAYRENATPCINCINKSHSTAGCITPCCCWLLLSSTHRQIADFLIACTCTWALQCLRNIEVHHCIIPIFVQHLHNHLYIYMRRVVYLL